MSCTRKIKDNTGTIRHTYDRPKTGQCDCGSKDGVLLNTNAYECPKCTSLRKRTSNRVSLSQRPTIAIDEDHVYLKRADQYDPQNWSCYR